MDACADNRKRMHPCTHQRTKMESVYSPANRTSLPTLNSFRVESRNCAIMSLAPHKAPLVNDLVGSGYSKRRLEYVEINVDGTVVDERRRMNATPVATLNDVGSTFTPPLILSLSSLCVMKLDGPLRRSFVGSRASGTASSLVD